MFTVPPGSDGVYYFSILFIFRYNNTTGVFTVPPGGDGVYYFSTFVMVDEGEWGCFNIKINDDIICTTEGDHSDNGAQDLAPASCSAVVDAVAGNKYLSYDDLSMNI